MKLKSSDRNPQNAIACDSNRLLKAVCRLATSVGLHRLRKDVSEQSVQVLEKFADDILDEAS
ncbi:hypothetical protein KIN20_023853 [Parelaphostrongylus tenuis]|uniref:Uncharacterized protein n=1 Tax=Parelaphostrongylus tenuis TaxID=148309 RepID=A0AAD5MW99_PARTN|nr:hypothetical protein KIN20_023853 [Parelaphostrongylus tenuis]